MSNALHDLDDLAGLWAEEPSAGEREEMQTIARRVSLRDTLLGYADPVFACFIATAVMVALFLQPAPVTLAVGLVASAALLWSSWKRYQLRRQIIASLEISDRCDLLERQIRRVRSSLHHAQLGLVAAPPVYLLFAMLTHSVYQGGTLAGFGPAIVGAMMDMPVGPAIAAALLTLMIQQVRSVRHLRFELQRLQGLAGEYREEMRLDRIALG